MSNVDTRHNVFPFVSGESKPFSGQRLAKVGYKSSKTNPAKFPSVYASIPVLDSWTENQNVRLRPFLVQMVQDTQDKVFRSLYESSDGTLTSISDADISVDQVIAYLESESTGDRLTKEKIGEWFEASMKDNLTVVIADKLGTENVEDVRIGQHLKGYKELFMSLSKDSGALQDTQIRGLRKAIEVSSVDDEVSKRLDAKLEAMQNRPPMLELLGL